MSRPIRTLLFSTLFPSSVRPVHGIFVETHLRELLKTGEVDTKVIAPVPWFPFSGKRFGEYDHFAATPYFEQWNDIDVFHPRYFLAPTVGNSIAPRNGNLRTILIDGENTAPSDDASPDSIPETLPWCRQAVPFRQQLAMAPREPIDHLYRSRTGTARRVVGLAEQQPLQTTKAEIT